jgi:hypothetical protein
MCQGPVLSKGTWACPEDGLPCESGWGSCPEPDTANGSEEEWRVIKNFPDYQVSSLGRIRRWRSSDLPKSHNAKVGRIMSTRVSRNGYELVTLSPGPKTMTVHSVVASAFIGDRPSGMDCNHKDGKKLNNSDVNLEWISKSDNCLHASRLGLKNVPKGEKSKRSTITESQVIQILNLCDQGVRNRDIAMQFQINPHLVSDIRIGKSWKHIHNGRNA